MARNPGNFMQEWIDGNVGQSTAMAALDELVAQCLADAKACGVSPEDVTEEVGTDIRTLIAEAIEPPH